MRTLLLFLCGALCSGALYAQCGAPIVTDWNAIDPENITIHFDPPEGAVSYHLEISGEYGAGDFINFSPLIIDSSVAAGTNTAIFDATELIPGESFGMNVERYYFSAELSVTCANGDESAINRFYVSPFSMRNDPALNVGEFFKPLTALPDGAGFSYDTYIAIPEGESPVEIENLSVFLDIGHTYAGDLSVVLISPQGISATLLDHPNSFGNEWGLSLMFLDSAQSIYNLEIPRGFCSPYDSLSVFEGTDPVGVWIVRVTDNLGIDDGMLFGVGMVINSSPCEAQLKGTAYFDNNGNNVKELEEPGLSMPLIESTTGGTSTSGNLAGYYSDCVLAGSGTASLVNPPLYYSAPDVPYTVTSGEILENIDFPLTGTPGMEDLSVTVFNSTPNRPGFESSYVIQYSNPGTECVPNVNISAVFEPYMSIVSVEGDSTSIDGDEANIYLGELCPQSEGMIAVTVLTADTVTIGTPSVVTASITPSLNDETPDDNQSVSSTFVVGSFDPNYKSVSETALSPMFLVEQQPLKYMVRFQNTGTYYAEQVLIVDTLDPSLDPSTFVLNSHSHPVEVTNSGNIYYFEFDEIFLPDSTTDEPGSHGFLRFEVTPYIGLADGTTIENTASIFFDFNPPIVTNTVVSTVDFSLGVNDLRLEAKVFPNPASEMVEIALPGEFSITSISIYGVSGKLVTQVSGNGKTRMQVPVSDLKSGTYVIRVNQGSLVRPVLFVKE